MLRCSAHTTSRIGALTPPASVNVDRPSTQLTLWDLHLAQENCLLPGHVPSHRRLPRTGLYRIIKVPIPHLNGGPFQLQSSTENHVRPLEQLYVCVASSHAQSCFHTPLHLLRARVLPSKSPAS